MPGPDPFSPTTQLAYDTAATRAGVVPGAKNVRQPKAWRPPQLATSQYTQGGLMRSVGAGQDVDRRRPMWTPQQLGMVPLSPWQRVGTGQDDYVADDIPEGNAPTLPPPASPPPAPIPLPVPDVQQPDYPGNAPYVPPSPPDTPPTAATPPAPAPRPRPTPAAPARPAPAPRAAAPAGGGGGTPSGGGGTSTGSADHDAFIQRMTPVALKYQQMYGIPANALIAINASESNWGNAPGNELFGIKAHAGTSSQSMGTWEDVGGQHVNENQNFSTYDSADAAYADFFDLISKSPTYRDAWTQYQQDGDWQALLANINKAGYATDPNWHNNIVAIQSRLPDTSGTKPYAGATDPRNGSGIAMAANQRDFENQAGLDPADAYTACGPVAAEAFAQTYGRYPTPAEAMELARQVGWTPGSGMAGAGSEAALLKKMGVDTQMDQGVDWSRVQSSVNSGAPVILDTPYHYFYISAYDASNGKYYVGNSGSVFRGGSDWMSPDEIASFGKGAPRASIYVASGTSRPAAQDAGTFSVDLTQPDEDIGAGQDDATDDGSGPVSGPDPALTAQRHGEQLAGYQSIMDTPGGGFQVPTNADIMNLGGPEAVNAASVPGGGYQPPTNEDVVNATRAANPQAGDLTYQDITAPKPTPSPVADTPVTAALTNPSDTRKSIPRTAVSTGPPPPQPQAPDQAPRDQPSATPDTATPSPLSPTAPVTARLVPPVADQPPAPAPPQQSDIVQATQAAAGKVVQTAQDVAASPAGKPIVDTVTPVANAVLTVAQVPGRVVAGALPVASTSTVASTGTGPEINPVAAYGRALQREQVDPTGTLAAEMAFDPLNYLDTIVPVAGVIGGAAASAVSPIQRIARAVGPVEEGGHVIPGLTRLADDGEMATETARRLGLPNATAEEGGVVPGEFRPVVGPPQTALPTDVSAEGLPLGGELPAPRPQPAPPGTPQLPTGERALATQQAPPTLEQYLGQQQQRALGGGNDALARAQGVEVGLDAQGNKTYTLSRQNGLAIPDDVPGGRITVTDVSQIPPEYYPKTVVPDYDSIHIRQSRDPFLAPVRRFMQSAQAPGETHFDPEVAAAHPLGNTVQENQINAAKRAAAGMPSATDPVTELYPGGWVQYHIDNVRGALSDRLAQTETTSTIQQIRDMAISRALKSDPLLSGNAEDNAYKLARLSAGAQGQADVWARTIFGPVMQRYGITSGAQKQLFEDYTLAVENLQRTLTQDITRNFHDPEEVRQAVMQAMHDTLQNGYPNVPIEAVVRSAMDPFAQADPTVQEATAAARAAGEETLRSMQPELVRAGRSTALESGPIIGTDSRAAFDHLEAILQQAEHDYGGTKVAMPPDPYPGAHIAPTEAPTSVRARWAQAHRGMTEAQNMIVQDMERVGILRPGTSARIADAHDTYTLMNTVDDHVGSWQDGVRQGKPQVTASVIVGREHPTDALTTTSMEDTIARASRMFDQINRQEVANTLQRYIRNDPSGLGSIMRKLTPPEMARLERGDVSEPLGKRIVAMYDRGEHVAYEMPRSIADSLNSISKWQVGSLEKIMGSASRIQAGVYTSLAPSFLLTNYARHEQTAFRNVPALARAFERGGVGGVATADRLLLQNLVTSLADSAMSGKRGRELADMVQAMDPEVRRTQGLGMAMSDVLQRAGDPRGALEAAGGQMHGASSVAFADRMFRPGARSLGLASDPTETAAQKAGRFVFGGPNQPFSSRIPIWSKYQEAMRAASETTEMATRVNMFKAVRRIDPSLSAKEAAYISRSATIDYAKGGWATKALNSIFPFVNSRVQATINPLVAMKTDPAAWFTNGALMTLPYLGLYALNRSQFSDEYDRISPSEKQNYFIIPLGTFTDDTGQSRMMRINWRKDETAMLVTNPLEQLLDEIFNASYNGQQLPPDKRTSQDTGKMWLQEIMDAAGWPTPPPGGNYGDLGGLPGVSAITALAAGAAFDIPSASLINQLKTQTDSYGDPIIPDTQKNLPKQYQWGGVYHPASSVLSNILSGIGGLGNNWVSSPAGASWLYQQIPILGGTLGGLDFLTERLGLPQLISEQGPYQQKLPPGAKSIPQMEAQYRLQQQQATQNEPGWMQTLGKVGFAFRSSASAQTLRAKLQEAPPEVRDQLEASLSAANDYDTWRQQTYYPARDAIMSDPNLTAQEKISQLHDLSQKRDQAFNDSYAKYPGAVTDYNQRQQLIDQIPGIPIGTEALNTPSNLPQGVDNAQMLSEYRNPIGPDGQPIDMSQLSPQDREQAQYRVAEKYANQYNVSPQVVMDSIKAQMGGKEVPVVGMPNAAIEDWVNHYMAPPNTTGYTDDAGVVNAAKYRTAQDTEIHLLSQQYGVDEQTIRDRINLRLQAPEEQGSDEASMNSAFDLASKVDDPTKFPKYIQRVTGANGQVYSVPYKNPVTGEAYTPDQWKLLDLQIQDLQAARKPRQPESEQQKDLKAAQMYGQLYRLQGLHQDPQAYADYQRWLGSYSQLTDEQYQQVQNGTTQRYRDLDPSNVAEANRRDYIIQQMKLTPNEPYNHTLSAAAWQALPQAERDRITQLHHEAWTYSHQAVADWQKVLQYNDLTGKVDPSDQDLFGTPGAPSGGTT